MTDVGARRPYVPSARETEEALAGPPSPVEPPVQDEGPPLAARIRGILGDLDPRRVAAGGPLLPLIVLGLLPLLARWDDAALGVLLPEMRDDFGFDLQFILGLQLAWPIFSQLTAPVMGYLADRLPRVWMLRAGAILANASTLVTATAGGAPGLVAGRVGSGTGDAVATPAGFPYLTDIYPSHTRSRVFAYLTMAGFLGAILGPVVGGNLGAAFGWRSALYVLGVLALVVSALTFLLREPARGYIDRIEMGADEATARREQRPVSWAEAWRTARSITTVRRLWWSTPFLEAGGQGVLTLMVFYYSDVFGLGPRTRGYIFMLSAVMSMVGLLFAGPVGDRILAYRPGRLLTIMGGLLAFQAAASVVLAVSPWWPLSVVVWLPTALVGSLFAPALYSLLSLTVPARIRGLGLQTIAPFRVVGLGLIYLLAGVGGEDLRLIMLLMAPLFAVGAAIIGTAAPGVEADIRSAKAASMAEEETRERSERLLTCRDVTVHFSGTQVLFGVSLDVDRGEIVALLGTNGAGKSTLLRAIAGTHEASGGAIWVDGEDITHVPPEVNAREGIVLVPGGRGIFPSLTVAENMRAAAWLVADEDPDPRIDDALDLFPILRERWGARAGDLSGGEQQMLALAQAFVARPKLMMIDELTLGLAPKIVDELVGIVRAINERGTTVVLVEQSVNTALRIADRAVFMEKGQVRFDGPTAELLERGDLIRSIFLGGATGGRAAPKKAAPKKAEAAETVLRAEDLSVAFGGVTALDGASLEVGRGEILGIIGPNGAGKTTLFDVITGFVPPDAGRVHIGPRDITDAPPHVRVRAGLARSFQDARLFAALTVREHVALAAGVHGEDANVLAAAAWLPQARRAERTSMRRADELIDTLGLSDLRDAFADELSIGQRRTLEIACQMAADPEVLLLDEPSSGLAQAETGELGPVIRRLVRDTGCSVVLIEHDVPLVTKVADRMVAMDLGRVIATGTPDEVVAHPDVVRSYLAPQMEKTT